jgi:hypothetical protein
MSGAHPVRAAPGWAPFYPGPGQRRFPRERAQ